MLKRNGEGKLGREERYRTVISGMEPRRIAEVMLLPRVLTIGVPRYGISSLPVNNNPTQCVRCLDNHPLSGQRNSAIGDGRLRVIVRAPARV
jgi:hypothetical protein